MNVFRPLALFSILLASAPSGAGKPGDAQVEEPDHESGDSKIEIFDNNKAEAICKVQGKVCLRAATGTEVVGADAAPVPVFKRREGASKTTWVLDYFAKYKKAAVAGSAQFIFKDGDDVVSMINATVKGTGSVSARVRVSTEDGFAANHTYHTQVAQILGGKQVILAEGAFQLK